MVPSNNVHAVGQNHPHAHSPHVWGRLVALFASVLVALASGTIYLYGVYAPQFIERVDLKTSDSASITLAINLGTGVGGIPAGFMIDGLGPQISILIGSLSLSMGYFGLFKIYQYRIKNILLISSMMILIGFGCITAYYATLKAAQSNFPNHRGAAGAAPVSAFGLSAIVFSVIAAAFFKDNSGGLLEFLSLGCGSITFVSSWFVHIYLGHGDELENKDVEAIREDTDETTKPIASQSNRNRADEQTALLSHRSSISSLNSALSLNDDSVLSSSAHSNENHNSRDTSLRGSFSFWGLGYRTPRSSSSSSISSDLQPAIQSLRDVYKSQSMVASTSQEQNNQQLFSRPESETLTRSGSSSALQNPNKQQAQIKGLRNRSKKVQNPIAIMSKLLFDRKFWAHYCLLGLLGGISQMYIYSVGFIATAQFNYENSENSPNFIDLSAMALRKLLGQSQQNELLLTSRSAASLQALQVSVISLASFIGRLSAGFTSDYLYKTYHIQRLWVIATTVMLLGIGQVSVMFNQNNTHFITASSIIIGVSFGCMFGTYPALIADSFGTRTFSTTWGLICTSCLFVLFALNKLFGSIYDRNTDFETGICYKGNGCYRGAFEVSSGLCIFSFLLCLMLIYSQRKKSST